MIHKINTMVFTQKNNSNNTYYIGRVHSMVDMDGVSHNEYDIITGNGDRNSKLKVTLEIIGEINENTNTIIEISRFLLEVGIHSFYIRDNDMRIIAEKLKIKRANENIEFYEKYKLI